MHKICPHLESSELLRFNRVPVCKGCLSASLTNFSCSTYVLPCHFLHTLHESSLAEWLLADLPHVDSGCFVLKSCLCVADVFKA